MQNIERARVNRWPLIRNAIQNREEENAALTGIFKNEDTLILTRKGFPSVTLFRERQKEPSKKSE